MENTPPVANLFCTNCGNAVSEQAIACMSCGARPTGHKKCCRQCGVALNPEQVVCVKCGAAIKSTFGGVTNPLVGINTGGMSVGDITILAAAALALISLFLPWIVLSLEIPFIGKISSNGFGVYAFWLGIAFIYPVWMTLAGLSGKVASINKVAGFVCAVLGFVGALAHVSFARANALDRALASLEKLGLGRPPREIEQGIASELFATGAGVYLFLCACIVLGIGVALSTRTSPNVPTALAALALGLLSFVFFAKPCFHMAQHMYSVLNSPDDFLVPPADFLTYFYPLCNIAIIFGVLMGHRRLKIGKTFTTLGLLFFAVTCVAYLAPLYLYQLPKFVGEMLSAHQEGIAIRHSFLWTVALNYLTLIPLILGIFLGHKGLKTSERMVAKLGLRLCWFLCWFICFWNILWLAFCLLMNNSAFIEYLKQ